MQKNHLKCRGFLLSSLISSLVIAPSNQAWSAAFQLKETTAALVGMSYAGTASKCGEISLQFNNPALMTTIDRSGADGSVSVILPNSKFKAGAQSGSGTNGGNGGKAAFVPAIYAISAPTSNLRFGLGLCAPYGLETKWDENGPLRFNAVRSKLTTVNFNPSVAYKTTPYLSIGAGLSIQYADVTLTKKSPLFPGAIVAGSYESLTFVDGHDTSIGFNIGVLLDCKQGTQVGLAYRSKITHGLQGTLKAGGQTARISADLTTPDTLDLSASHRFNENWSLHASVVWTGWKAFNELKIRAAEVITGSVIKQASALAGNYAAGAVIESERQGYKNSYFFALGTQYTPCKNWAFSFGVAHDQTPIKDQYRTARLPGADRYWVSTGLNYMPRENAKIGLHYAHLFIRDGKIDKTNATGLLTTQRIVGRFKNSVNLIGFNISYKF